MAKTGTQNANKDERLLGTAERQDDSLPADGNDARAEQNADTAETTLAGDGGNDPDADGVDDRADGKPGGPLMGSGLTSPTVAAENPDAHDDVDADGDHADDDEDPLPQAAPRAANAADYGAPPATTVSVNVSDLTSAALGRINGVLQRAKLTPEEYDRVQRCTSRLIVLGVSIQTAAEKDKARMMEQTELDLSTLEALAETKGIDVAKEVRNAAYLTVLDWTRAGLSLLAKFAVGAVVAA